MDKLNALLAFLALTVGVVSAIYARNSFIASKTPSFPRRNSNIKSIEIKHLSKEARQFNSFIYKNADKRVYLNILLDADHFEMNDMVGEKGKWTNIWINSFEKVSPGDELSNRNSTGLNVSFMINPSSDAKIYWDKGRHLIKGHFCILGYGGPQQGYMGCVLRTDDI